MSWALAAPRLLACLVLLALVTGVSGCGQHDPAALQALKEDPLADWKPEGGTVENEFEDEQHPGNAWTKPRQAKVVREIRVAGPAEVQEALSAGTEFAADHGWTALREGSTRLTKESGTWQLEASILPAVSSPDTLTVTLKVVGEN